MSEPQTKPEHHIDIEYLKQEFEHIRAEMAGARERLSENAQAALDRVTAYLNNAGLSSRIGSVEEDLEELAGKFKDSGKDALCRLEHQVTARPITSVAVAFGIGLLAARLLRRH